jgi:hypothetical protein
MASLAQCLGIGFFHRSNASTAEKGLFDLQEGAATA